MKISDYDRLNAIVRSEVYKVDYAEYVKQRGNNLDFYVGDGTNKNPYYHITLSKPGQALCKKWGLLFPIDPSAQPINDYLYCLNQPIQFVPAPAKWKSYQANTIAGSDEKLITHINDKLALLVDLSSPKEKLRTQFDRLLATWHRKQKRGTNETLVNKWEVYDKQSRGKSLLEITREIYNLEKSPINNPNYNDEMNKNYQRVKRAAESAKKIVHEVELEIALD